MKLKAAPARLSTVSATFEAEFKARLHWSAEADAAPDRAGLDDLEMVLARERVNLCEVLRIRAVRVPMPAIAVYAIAIVANAVGIGVLLRHYY